MEDVKIGNIKISLDKVKYEYLRALGLQINLYDDGILVTLDLWKYQFIVDIWLDKGGW